MAENAQPSNSDILSILKKIDSRLDQMRKRLNSLEEMKEKVSEFDRDLKRLFA